MKYVDLEGKNEITAKVDFVNTMEIDCEICNISCTWEDINIDGTWGEDAMLICDDCKNEN